MGRKSYWLKSFISFKMKGHSALNTISEWRIIPNVLIFRVTQFQQKSEVSRSNIFMMSLRVIQIGALAFILALLIIYVVQDSRNSNQVREHALSTGTTNKMRENLENIQQLENSKETSMNVLQKKQNDDDWRSVDVAIFNSDQLHDYLYWTNRSSCNLIHDFGGFMINSTILRKLWKGTMGFWKTMEQMPVGIDGQYPVCLDPIPPHQGTVWSTLLVSTTNGVSTKLSIVMDAKCILLMPA